MKRKLIIFGILFLMIVGTLKLSQHINLNPFKTVGEELDSFNGVAVFYNGGVNNVEKRNLTKDGYNLGLQYQCVEFVKRYYYKYFNHKMPDSYGHAKDFFNRTLKDGDVNTQRNLIQYTNGSLSKPKVNDLLVFDASWYNSFGHVAIVMEVSENSLTIIQQNAGPFSSSRATFSLVQENNHWKIEDAKVLGWLRKE